MLQIESADSQLPTPDSPAIFVVGPTAAGKTALAITLAQRFNGEIVNADSRAFYRGMDIGTAKPAPAERAAAPHHLIDVADPDEPLSLGWFLDRARAVIADIHARGRRAIVCGGSGQYVRALREDWQPPRVPPDPAIRAALEARLAAGGLTPLVAELHVRDPAAAARIDHRNPRRVVRALELALSGHQPGADSGALEQAGTGNWGAGTRMLVLGLAVERSALYARIDARVDAMFAAGLVDEVRALNAHGYACTLPAFSAIGYREVCRHLAGDLTLEEARSRTKFSTHRLARTQATWFRRDDPHITWLDAGPDLDDRAAAVIRGQLSALSSQHEAKGPPDREAEPPTENPPPHRDG